MSFFNDLQREKLNEAKIARFVFGLLAGACCLFFACFEGRSLFDFGCIWEGSFRTFEVKTDYKAGATSPNAFLETGNTRTGKPSGLTVTVAHRVLLYVPALGQIYSFPPSSMMTFMENECEECQFLKGVGDGNAQGYLVPLTTLEKLAFVKVLKYDEE